jgi:outer membrane protein TolC
LNYAFASANLTLAEQTLKAQLDSYNLNKKRFDVGIDSEIPYVRHKFRLKQPAMMLRIIKLKRHKHRIC